MSMISSKSKSGLCALTLAARQGHVATLEVLLRGLPDPALAKCLALTDDKGNSLVHLAAIAGQPATLQALLAP